MFYRIFSWISTKAFPTVIYNWSSDCLNPEEYFVYMYLKNAREKNVYLDF